MADLLKVDKIVISPYDEAYAEVEGEESILTGRAPTLGLYRIKLVECTGLLLRTGYFWVWDQLVLYGIVDLYFDLFFSYPLNSILHSFVSTTVVSLLPPNFPFPDLTLSLLKDTNLLKRIADESQSEHKVGGFMGHVWTILQRIDESPEACSFAKEYYASDFPSIKWEQTLDSWKGKQSPPTAYPASASTSSQPAQNFRD